MAGLVISVGTIGISSHNTEATLISDLCENLGISCEDVIIPLPSEPSPSEPSQSEPSQSEPSQSEPSQSEPSQSEKFFTALFLQYVDEDAQVEIYKPNMGSEDMTRLRVQDDDVLKPEYVQAAQSLPGKHGVAFTSSQAIVENAKRVKDLGFDYIEFNLESEVSPGSDNNDVVGAMKKAAEAAHAQGLKFRATPSKSYTTDYGTQIAPFVDYYHIQAQALQGDGIEAYSDYVHTTISNLKDAKSGLIISVQVSTQQDNAPGLSLLETLKQCTDSVMDVADGTSVWFGGDDLSILKSFVQWYNDKWS
jgi:hypothetical protein